MYSINFLHYLCSAKPQLFWFYFPWFNLLLLQYSYFSTVLLDFDLSFGSFSAAAILLACWTSYWKYLLPIKDISLFLRVVFYLLCLLISPSVYVFLSYLVWADAGLCWTLFLFWCRVLLSLVFSKMVELFPIFLLLITLDKDCILIVSNIKALLSLWNEPCLVCTAVYLPNVFLEFSLKIRAVYECFES